MATEEQQKPAGVGNAGASHGGRLAARALASRGVSHLFTLSGGHLFSLYDGCKEEGIEIVDVRHEQSAVFAAEGWAKATRTARRLRPDRRPRRHQRGQRARRRRLQRLAAGRARRPRPRDDLGNRASAGDRSPAVRLAAGEVGRDGQGRERDPGGHHQAQSISRIAAPSGPTFLDYPLDVVFTEAEVDPPPPPAPCRARARGRGRGGRRAAGGGGAAGDHGRHRRLLGRRRAAAAGARRAARHSRLPERHGPRLRARPTTSSTSAATRGAGLGGCDVAVVIGVPLDFRLGFGGAINAEAKLIRVDVEPNRLERNRARRLSISSATSRATPRAPSPKLPPAPAASRADRCLGRRAARGRGREAGRRERRASATSARRCTRCASTPSSPRCSTATRS